MNTPTTYPRLLVGSLLACVSLLSLPSAKADNLFWNDSSDGDWSDPDRWNLSGVPTINDVAFFQQNATYTVSLSGDSTAGTVAAFAGNVTLETNGYSLTTGAIVVANGASFLAKGGSFEDAGGAVNYIGYDTDNNTFTLDEGATFEQSGRTLLGPLAGGNRLIVQAGSSLTTSGQVALGYSGGTNNSILITGTGSSYNAIGSGDIDFYIGGVAAGVNGDGNSVRVEGGGVLNISGSRWLRIGNNGESSGNSLVITGSGSSFNGTGTGNVIVGGVGGGSGTDNTLIIENDASFSIDGAVGITGQSGNSMVIDGGSAIIKGGLYNDGNVTIKAGTVNVATLQSSATASLMLEGGELRVTGDVDVLEETAFSVGNGTGAAAQLTLNASSGVFAGGLLISSDGILAGTGSTASAIKTFSSDSRIAPGDGGIGTLTVGSLDLTEGATFVFDLGLGNTSDLLLASFIDATGVGEGGLLVDLQLLGEAGEGVYTLISFDLATGLTESQFALTHGLAGYNASFSLSGNDLQLTLVGIPEPSAIHFLFLLGLGYAGVKYGEKRRKVAAV